MTKPAPLDSVFNVAMTTADGLSLVTDSDRLSTSFDALATRWNGSEAAQIEHLTRSAHQLDAPDPDEAARVGMVKWRKSVSKEIDAQAIPLRRSADSILAVIDASLEATKTPSHIMSRMGLHESERQAFYELTQLVENVGIGTLINQLRTAVKTGNKLLACAITARMERMTPEQRNSIPFSREQVAFHFFGKQHAELMTCLLRAKLNATKAKAQYATLREWGESKLEEATMVDGVRKLTHKPIGTMRPADRIAIGLIEKQLAEAIEDAKAKA